MIRGGDEQHGLLIRRMRKNAGCEYCGGGVLRLRLNQDGPRVNSDFLQLLTDDEAEVGVRQCNVRRKLNGLRCCEPQGTLLEKRRLPQKLAELLWVGLARKWPESRPRATREQDWIYSLSVNEPVSVDIRAGTPS